MFRLYIIYFGLFYCILLVDSKPTNGAQLQQLLGEITKEDMAFELQKLITRDYMTNLTNILVDNVAESITNLLKHKIVINNFEKILTENRKDNHEDDNLTLDQRKARSLLEDSNSDGDNLEGVTPYFSDAEVKTEPPNTMPTNRVMINGKYYRGDSDADDLRNK